MAKQRTISYLVAIIVTAVLFACSTEQKADEKQSTSVKSTAQSDENPRILFFGNSLTAGYGLEQAEAYPALIQQKLDSLGLRYEVINAGNSGETSSGGLGRINWVLKGNIEVFVLELGANDGLRGIPTEETYANLKGILDKVKEAYPKATTIVAGMMVPPNMGPEYGADFKAIFPRLAEETNSLLIPFFLEDVAGIPALNQSDGIHPTAEGQKIVAQNVWNVLGPALNQ